MARPSLEDLKRIIRKMEFNKTEPELLIDLVHKGIKAGEYERERLRRVNKKSLKVFELLKERVFFFTVKEDEQLLSELKLVPVGAIDGSFQVVGGVGGRWYVVLGVSQIIAERGFTTKPTIKVDGGIEPLDDVDERYVNQRGEILMMLGEIKALRMISDVLSKNKSESYVLIDGPIIDPPLYSDEKYVEERISALQLCHDRGVNVVGLVKRIRGNNFLNYLENEIGKENVDEFTNDLDLLSTVMFNAVKSGSCSVYTLPIAYEEGIKGGYEVETYKAYKDKGLTVYYSYYKPLLRGRVFRVEYASFKSLNRQELDDMFSRIFMLINKVWTFPGMDEPLLITLAHNKCNVRRGAAETLYYEIIAKALSEGNLHLWLESLSA